MKASEFQVRRVIHGTLASGESGVIEDGPVPNRLVTPAFTLVDVWRFRGLPTAIDPTDSVEEVVLTPPPGEAVLRLASIVPDAEVGASMKESLSAIGHEEGEENEKADAGFHATDTIDGVVVLSGEVFCVTDTGETHLKTGDVVMQIGNSHKWSNRSDEPCVVAFVMASGTRA